ncbi:hypothetical protein EON67_11590 [archaeon]|nr:MAG: hypothetical protein EON67_11590 [archaeon]
MCAPSRCSCSLVCTAARRGTGGEQAGGCLPFGLDGAALRAPKIDDVGTRRPRGSGAGVRALSSPRRRLHVGDCTSSPTSGARLANRGRAACTLLALAAGSACGRAWGR